MTVLIDKRTDAEVFEQLRHEAEVRNALNPKRLTEDELARAIRSHLLVSNGRFLTQVKTDAPLSLTGQWHGE